jgi:hypothetical protein
VDGLNLVMRRRSRSLAFSLLTVCYYDCFGWLKSDRIGSEV